MEHRIEVTIVMSEFNPYAAPDLKGEWNPLGEASEPLFIANSCLVAPKNSDLPDICVFTGKVGNNIYVKKTLVYAPSWVLIILLLNLLIGAIVYLLVRKKGNLGYYISPEAKAARFKLALINWGIFLASFGAIPIAMWLESPAMGLVCPVLWLVSSIIYIAKIQGITPNWIDHTTIGVKGIPLPVMQQLVEASQL